MNGDVEMSNNSTLSGITGTMGAIQKSKSKLCIDPENGMNLMTTDAAEKFLAFQETDSE